MGLLKTSTDFNGRTTTNYYDAANRPEYTFYPTGVIAQNWYHPSIAYQSQITYFNGTWLSHSDSYFNGRGQPTLSSHYAKNTNNYWDPQNIIQTNFTYDVMGRKATVSVPHQQNVATTGYTAYEYDVLSRVKKVTAPDGSISETFYNQINSKPSSALSDVGNTVRSRDAWGRERWARTDDFGRLVEVVEPDPNGNGDVMAAGNMQTQYTYNTKDELTQVNQGSQARLFWYDSLGRLVRQKLAEQNGSLTAGGQFVGGDNGGWSDTFVYDNRSNLTQRTDARGVKTIFWYGNDPLNRLQNVGYDKTGADTTYPIQDASPTWLYYMTTGDKTRVRMAQTWGTTEENSYDTEGRVSEYKMTLGGRENYPLVTNYLYDSLSRLTEVRYPASYGMAGNTRKTVTPTYDETSRLKELKVDNQIQMSDIQYNPLSQVTQLKTGAATGNTDIEQYSYDGQTGLLTNQKVIKQNSNQTLLDLSYNYNRLNSKGSLNGKTGQLTNVVDNLNQNKNRVFEFDTLGRLITGKGGIAAGGSGTANWTQTYGYDRYGNRQTITASGVTQNSQAVPTDGIANQTYNAWSNQITTAGYIYDLAGNLVKGQMPDGTWQRFEYDAAGRQTVAKKDADGWIQQVNGYGSSRQRTYSWSYASSLITYYAWGGSSVIAEYTLLSGTTTLEWAKSYIYAGSRLLSTFTKNGGGEKLEFHHPDRLGTRLVTDNTANTSFEQNTLPFGTALDAETTGSTNQRFTSYDRSTVASLDYAVNRSYSSGQGRFTTVDPIGMNSGSNLNPQSNNLYAYVQNNPVDLSDPTGLDWECRDEYKVAVTCVDGDCGIDFEHSGWVTSCRWIPYKPRPIISDPGDRGGVNIGSTNSHPGGPYHPPSGVPTKCNATDSCSEIEGKMFILRRMVGSHTGWDQNMPSPRGGGRHKIEIGQLWKQYADCQSIYESKCGKKSPIFPVPVPAKKPDSGTKRVPIDVPPPIILPGRPTLPVIPMIPGAVPASPLPVIPNLPWLCIFFPEKCGGMNDGV